MFASVPAVKRDSEILTRDWREFEERNDRWGDRELEQIAIRVRQRNTYPWDTESEADSYRSRQSEIGYWTDYGSLNFDAEENESWPSQRHIANYFHSYRQSNGSILTKTEYNKQNNVKLKRKTKTTTMNKVDNSSLVYNELSDCGNPKVYENEI